MRKTSQDGGDSTSITSNVENEVKKSVSKKTKKTSIKRKVHNFNHESDETVMEPLLEKEQNESTTKNAKYILPKTKTDSSSEKNISINIKQTTVSTVAEQGSSGGTKENNIEKLYADVTAPIHNHMNTNVFSNIDTFKGPIIPKTHILVEIGETKQGGYIPGPLIFTTAKIHTDGKTKHMEPVQVTPMPILSTVEAKRKDNIIPTSYTSSGVNLGNNLPKDKAISIAAEVAESRQTEDILKYTPSESTLINSINKNVLESSDITNSNQTTVEKDRNKSEIYSEVIITKNSAASSVLFHDNNKTKHEQNYSISPQSCSSITTNVTPAAYATTISNVMEDPKNKGDKTSGIPTKDLNLKQQKVPDVNKNVQSASITESHASGKSDNAKNILDATETGRNPNINTSNIHVPPQKDRKMEDNTEKRAKISDQNDLSIGPVLPLSNQTEIILLSKSKANIANTTAIITNKQLILSTTVQSSSSTGTVSVTTSSEVGISSAKVQPGAQTKINSETKHSIVNSSSHSTIATAISKSDLAQLASTTKATTTNNVVSKPITSMTTKANTSKKVTTVPNYSTKAKVTTSVSTKPTALGSSKPEVTTNASSKPSTTNNTSTKVALASNATSKVTTVKSVTSSSTSKSAKPSAPVTAITTISIKQPTVSTGKPIDMKVTPHTSNMDKVSTSVTKSIAGSINATKVTPKVSSIPVTTKGASTSTSGSTNVKTFPNKNNEHKSNEPSKIGKNFVAEK